jgi:hypothetical protein
VRKDRKDWTGQKYHSLTFLTPTDRRSGKSVMWEALCDCGNITVVRPVDVVKGHTRGCGCQKLKGAVERGKLTRKFDPRISSARAVWRRTYNDGLSFENFLRLSQLNCHYCNSAPSRIYNLASKNYRYTSDLQKLEGNFTFNGLDRVDNKLGHNIENVVPCCAKCNYMKMDQTQEEFFAHMRKILAHCNET